MSPRCDHAPRFLQQQDGYCELNGHHAASFKIVAAAKKPTWCRRNDRSFFSLAVGSVNRKDCRTFGEQLAPLPSPMLAYSLQVPPLQPAPYRYADYEVPQN